MSRPNFQQIENEPEKNYLKYVGLYRMDNMVSTYESIRNDFGEYNSDLLSSQMDKLKLLNYENTLLKEIKMKPLNRYYFLYSTNTGEQFFMFTSLCAFCARKMGKDFEQPQEFNDPTVLVSQIVKLLQELDISTDFPSNKLMAGAGFICYYVLDCLVTQALKINRAHLPRPEIKVDDEIKPELVENTNEIILEKVDDEQNHLFHSDDDLDDDDDDDDNNEIDIGGRINLKSSANTKLRDLSAGQQTKAERNSLLTGEMWKMEMERALPQLKIVIKPDLKDWRARWEQMKQCREQINLVRMRIEGFFSHSFYISLCWPRFADIGRDAVATEEDSKRCHICHG